MLRGGGLALLLHRLGVLLRLGGLTLLALLGLAVLTLLGLTVLALLGLPPLLPLLLLGWF